MNIQDFIVFLGLLLVTLTQGANSTEWYSNSGAKYWQKRPQHSRELSRVWVAEDVVFRFPNEQSLQEAIKNGKYVQGAGIPIDVDVYYGPQGPRLFTTVPRFGSGVPYTLAEVTKACTPKGAEIRPYPSYKWHKSHGADCKGLTSVFRMHIDACGRMWVLDSGEINYVHYCAPSIRVFDLTDDRLIFSYYLPREMYKPGVSRFMTIYVDFVNLVCSKMPEEAYVYSADVGGFGIVVSHIHLGSKHVRPRSWRIENKYTYPDPDFGTLTIAEKSFELMAGVFSFSVTPSKLGLRRNLYFHSLSSDLQMAIPLDIVRNESHWNAGYASALNEFRRLGNRCMQCGIETITQDGHLICAHLYPLAIFAWNIRTPYTAINRINVLANNKTLQFNSGAKTIFNPYTKKEEVFILTNSLQNFLTNSMDYNKINYRIQCCQSDQLISKTQRCTCGVSEAFVCLNDL